MTELKPVREPKTRAERIRENLADEIARGILSPGVALDEMGLAQRFGVSRTPIREAIRQLEAIGFAEARPRRGAVVATITKERLHEMFSVMSELEAVCAKLSAIQMTPVQKETLRQVHEESRHAAETDDTTRYAELNARFHETIYSGTNNSFMMELTESVRTRVAPYRRAQFWNTGRVTLSFSEHDAVVQAILQGNGDAAYQAMHNHVDTVSDAVDDIA
jgi:DNA-binding GntR family transcriptional regulator